MKNTLIDAGPLIALFNKNDKYHEKIKEFIKNYKGLLTTSWPVITEVCQFIRICFGSQFYNHPKVDITKGYQIQKA